MHLWSSRGLWAAGLALVLAACSSAPQRPQPTPLAPVTPAVSLAPVWQAQLGPSDGLVRMAASGGEVAMVSSEGVLQVRVARTGEIKWQLPLGKKILTGVGFDGKRVALVDGDNNLIIASAGKVLWQASMSARSYALWRVPMLARSYTPPLVAGDRVFVLNAQRDVLAFDADTGALLWRAPYTGEALVLQAPGLLAAYGNSLLVGWGERLVGLHPDTGKPYWSAALTLPRGINEIERLIDVVAGAHAAQGKLCARAFQAVVSCVDIQSGQRVWSHDSDGYSGVAGDEDVLVGTDRSGRVQAWKLSDGQSLWTQDALRYRRVTGPTMLGMSFVVGDGEGYVHWLSKTSGRVLNRMATDGSAILSPPVLADGTLIVQTSAGGVFAWQPK